MHLRFPLVVGTLLVLALPVTPATASFNDLYREYLNEGVISACSHSEQELQGALLSIPTDIQAYDPSFSDAINLALNGRAAGGCKTGGLKTESHPPLPGTAIADDGSPGPHAGRPNPRPPLQADSYGHLAVDLPFGLLSLCGAVALGIVLGSRRRPPAPRRDWH